MTPKDAMKDCPSIQGHVTLRLEERGKLVKQVEGYNIWTLTGREFLSELIGLKAFHATVPGNRQFFREDRVAYIGVGTGTQTEVAEVSSLVSPVAANTGATSSTVGTFLMPLDAPATLPATSLSTTNTSVQFIKTFGLTEISFGTTPVAVTEAGLFTDGDPTNNFAVPIPSTAWADASTIAPVAYKTFEPITKTQNYTLKVVWEVKFI